MLDEQTKTRVREAVGDLAIRFDHSRRLAPYTDRRWVDEASAYPVLHLEDVSGIPFVSLVPGVEEYQHRARVRAGDGDLFAAVTPPTAGFEEYCRDRLRLGSPQLIHISPGDHDYAVARACGRSPAFAQISAVARQAGGLAIHPYMAIEDVWTLAASLARDSAVPVHVLGPPPPTLWIANDKGTLSQVVSSVLSPDWLVETHRATEPVEMARHLLRLARRHQKAGLKRTRCASAMGNAVYDLARIEKLPQEEIVDEVKAFLERTEWAVDEEVLIVAWELADASPSTQLWIPLETHGPPRVDGVYEQILEGEEKCFLGSRPSTLAPEINQMLIDASLVVATALQMLGYVGRCSFDFIVGPDDDGGCRAKFTECNGRWGGTSTPMHLIDRLRPGRRPSYWAQDFMHHGLIGARFGEILERTGDELFDPLTGRGRYIYYNVGPLQKNGKLDVIALGETAAAAEQSIHDDLPRRLGLEV